MTTEATDDKLETILRGVYERGQLMGTVQTVEGFIPLLEGAPDSEWRKNALELMKLTLQTLKKKQETK